MRRGYDTVVIGAGPVGSVAARGFAHRGARVLLLEANPAAANRFAGEWLHPPGVQVLERFGLMPLEAVTPEATADAGFVVYPDDGSEPIRLDYPAHERSLTCEHSALVEELRRKARERPEVDYRPYARVTALDDGRVHYLDMRTRRQHSVRAELIVAADGGSSVSRPPRPAGSSSSVVSYMGALTLHGVDLPFEGYGHVVLGGPGPLLVYRLDAERARVSLDVPAHASALRRDRAALLDAFKPVLVEPLSSAFETALATQRVHWAATHFRPRTNYGRGRLAVVGDAVGTFHPMTAAGMTVGMQDVAYLLDADSPASYQARRSAGSHVPELLSSALYRVFVDSGDSAHALRQAVYATWRRNPGECQRTMRLLSGAETRATAFAAAFLRIGLHAMTRAAGPSLVPWSRWPLAGLLPHPVRQRLRRGSSIDAPFQLPSWFGG